MFDTTPAIDCAGKKLLLDRPLIMGIVNVTPDSFSDGGDHPDCASAFDHAMQLIDEGADILDIGGESTRPGASPVSGEEELARVIPLIEKLATQTNCVISIDTSKPEVMHAAINAGAGMINDVYALRHEGALDAAAALKVPVVLMHMQGEPRTMQTMPVYNDVVADVHRFLAERLFAAEMSGIQRKNIILDPGFGFGKTAQDNWKLLAALDRFTDFGLPVLAGLSRKRSIGEATGHDDPKLRVYGSVAAHLLAVQGGANIVRVHDVAATRDALKILQMVRGQQSAVRNSAATKPDIQWPDD